jgi:hypothetical protein
VATQGAALAARALLWMASRLTSARGPISISSRPVAQQKIREADETVENRRHRDIWLAEIYRSAAISQINQAAARTKYRKTSPEKMLDRRHLRHRARFDICLGIRWPRWNGTAGARII